MDNEDLKKIAQAMLDMLSIRENSYTSDNEMIVTVGSYAKSFEQAAEEAVSKHNLPTDLWYLMFLASDWGNDIQEWAKAVLSDQSFKDLLV